MPFDSIATSRTKPETHAEFESALRAAYDEGVRDGSRMNENGVSFWRDAEKQLRAMLYAIVSAAPGPVRVGRAPLEAFDRRDSTIFMFEDMATREIVLTVER